MCMHMVEERKKKIKSHNRARNATIRRSIRQQPPYNHRIILIIPPTAGRCCMWWATGLEKLCRDRPSTGYFGNWGIVEGCKRVSRRDTSKVCHRQSRSCLMFGVALVTKTSGTPTYTGMGAFVILTTLPFLSLFGLCGPLSRFPSRI